MAAETRQQQQTSRRMDEMSDQQERWLAKGTGKRALASALLVAGAAPFLLSSNGGGRRMSASGGTYPPLPRGGDANLTSMTACPPGMTYGLRPVSEDPSAEASSASRGLRRLQATIERRQQKLQPHGPVTYEMGCVATTYNDPDDGTCLNALPYGIMHDARPDEVRSYQEHHEMITKGSLSALHHSDWTEPEIATLPPGSSFANWDCRHHEDRCKGGDKNVNGLSHLQGSAWTKDGEDAFGPPHSDRWAPHSNYLRLAGGRVTVLEGVDVVAHTGHIASNFGHILHDNLPTVAWLRSILPPTTVFLLPNHKKFKGLVSFIDPEFAAKRVRWYNSNEVIYVKDGTLTVSNQAHMMGRYGNTLWRHLRRWIAENHSETYPDEEKTIVYYARGSIPDFEQDLNDDAHASALTRHGRVPDPHHERDIVTSILGAMKRHGRTEKLVYFTGSDENGDTLSYEEQFNIFRRASAMIGPHGSGLANSIWTDPFPGPDCNRRVKMLEFIPARDSADVQILYNGYYWVMRGMPIEWHQVAYAANSTTDVTYIRLTDLENALDDMWGPKN